MKVRPFIYVNGIPTLRDSDLIKCFDQMKRDGTDRVVFYNGDVRSGAEFVEFIKLPSNMFYVVYEEDKFLGCGWFNNVKHKSADAHFCVFAEGWNRSVEIGKLLIEKSMATAELNLLVGYVPGFNKLAIDFAKKCGAVFLGELPFGSCDREGNLHPLAIVYYVR